MQVIGGSESSRKMQDKEETTPEVSWAAGTGRKKKEGLEADGETETPEVIVLWNEVEGDPAEASLARSTAGETQRCELGRMPSHTIQNVTSVWSSESEFSTAVGAACRELGLAVLRSDLGLTLHGT